MSCWRSWRLTAPWTSRPAGRCRRAGAGRRRNPSPDDHPERGCPDRLHLGVRDGVRPVVGLDGGIGLRDAPGSDAPHRRTADLLRHVAANRSTATSRSAPEDRRRIPLDLRKQVRNLWARLRTVVPVELQVLVTPVDLPESRCPRVTQARDREPCPLRSDVRAPGGPGLHDRQVPRCDVDLDAELVVPGARAPGWCTTVGRAGCPAREA